MYSKILIAFDGNNLNVIRALAHVSRSPDAKVFLITVVRMTLIEKIGRPLFSLINKDWRPATYAGLKKSTTTAAQDLAAYSGKVASYVRIGDPYLEIKKLIKEVQPAKRYSPI